MAFQAESSLSRGMRWEPDQPGSFGAVGGYKVWQGARGWRSPSAQERFPSLPSWTLLAAGLHGIVFSCLDASLSGQGKGAGPHNLLKRTSFLSPALRLL